MKKTNHARTYRRARLLANVGVGLAVIGYVSAFTGHEIIGALPFLVGLFFAVGASHAAGGSSAFLAAWIIEEGEGKP